MTLPAKIWKATLDCNDIEVTTASWSRILGVGVTFENGNTRFLGPPGENPLADPVLCLQQVDEPRSGKNRMHLDLIAEDLDAMVDLVSLHGGKRLSDLNEVPGGGWYVVADPEGNEFCLVSFGPQGS